MVTSEMLQLLMNLHFDDTLQSWDWEEQQPTLSDSRLTARLDCQGIAAGFVSFFAALPQVSDVDQRFIKWNFIIHNLHICQPFPSMKGKDVGLGYHTHPTWTCLKLSQEIRELQESLPIDWVKVALQNRRGNADCMRIALWCQMSRPLLVYTETWSISVWFLIGVSLDFLPVVCPYKQYYERSNRQGFDSTVEFHG